MGNKRPSAGHDPESPMSPKNSRWFITALLAFGILGSAPTARAEDASTGPDGALQARSPGVIWVAPEKALATAKRLKKPILYDFTAAWCPPCRMLHRELFEDPKAARYINKNFVPVRVMDRSREDGRNKPIVERLQAKYEIGAFPTMILTTHDLSRSAQIVGYVDRAQALSLFEKFLAKKP